MADQNVTLGIDLGTTNSAIAVTEAGQAEILENKEGDRTTPSIVRFSKSDDNEDATIVGEKAKNRAIEQPDRTVSSIKRHMGEDDYTCSIDGEEYKPEEISAYILSKLRTDTANRLGLNESSLTSVVVTVPAYFTEDSRQSTRDAAKIAGFKNIEIINEPSASAMAYGYRQSSNRETILVYDLGGGTFDVSVLTIGDGMFEVQATNGIRDLGGDDWDDRLVDWLRDEFEEQHGVDPLEGYSDREEIQKANDPDLLERTNRLYEEARARKEEISTQDGGEVRSYIPYLAEVNGEPKTLEANLSHEEFKDITRDLIQQTADPTLDTIDEAGYKANEIDEVLLIGGSSRMQQVEEIIGQTLNQEPNRTVNPDEAVAQGAALKGNQDDILLQEVTPLSLGVAVKNGTFERIIDRNTTLPAEGQKMFTTAQDGHTSIRIDVFQGEREIANENRHLKQFYLDGIPPQPRGMPSIRVTFRVGSTGLVTARAEDIKSQDGERVEEVQIEGSNNLSDNEIDQLVRKAEEKEEADKRERKLRETRQEAKQRLKDAQTVLSNHREDLSENGINTIKQQINRVENGLTDQTITATELEKRVDTLLEIILDVGEQIEARQRQANPQETGTTNESSQSIGRNTSGSPEPSPTAQSQGDEENFTPATTEELSTGSQPASSANESTVAEGNDNDENLTSGDTDISTGKEENDELEQSAETTSKEVDNQDATTQTETMSTADTDTEIDPTVDGQSENIDDETVENGSNEGQENESTPPDSRGKTTNPDYSNAVGEYSTSGSADNSNDSSSKATKQSESDNDHDQPSETNQRPRYSYDLLDDSDSGTSNDDTTNNEQSTDEVTPETTTLNDDLTEDTDQETSISPQPPEHNNTNQSDEPQQESSNTGTKETEDTPSTTSQADLEGTISTDQSIEEPASTETENVDEDTVEAEHREEEIDKTNSDTTEDEDNDEDETKADGEEEDESMEDMFRKLG